jgi:hypothetical protein
MVKKDNYYNEASVCRVYAECINNVCRLYARSIDKVWMVYARDIN